MPLPYPQRQIKPIPIEDGMELLSNQAITGKTAPFPGLKKQPRLVNDVFLEISNEIN